jgi:hypothetical protein
MRGAASRASRSVGVMRGMAVTVSRAFGEGVAGHLLSEGGLKLLKLAVEKPPFGCGRLRLYPGSVIRFPRSRSFHVALACHPPRYDL